MRNLKHEFQNRQIDYQKLLEYGFTKKDKEYYYEQLIQSNNFKIIIEISNKNQSSKVIDNNLNEEYILVDVKNSQGEFVGQIREEYENLLNDIIKKCTTPNVFKSPQAQELIKYVKEKYNDELEYLWEKFPNNAIWRNQINQKWYGAILVIPEKKLGNGSDELIEIIDLRYQKEQIIDFIDNQKIFPGYHMNKSNWITIKLDGSISTTEIISLIDNSYNLSLEK